MLHAHNFHETGPDGGLAIDYVRAQGPVQRRLRRRFGVEMANALTGLNPAANDAITIGVASDRGGRPRNEDSAIALVAHPGPEDTSEPVVLAAVADGMGGLANGDEASAIAVETLTEEVVDALQDNSQHPGSLNTTTIQNLLTGVVNDTNKALTANPEVGGTTLTAALTASHTATLAHIGDSRAYLLDFVSGEIHQLTRDHTIAGKMAEVGLLSEREAAHHPQSHSIYHAIGLTDSVEADIIRCPLVPNSALLLCSDGVWRNVDADDIYSIVVRAYDPQAACEELITTATQGEGYDDLTAVLVRMPD